jgi:hypothetical protein
MDDAKKISGKKWLNDISNAGIIFNNSITCSCAIGIVIESKKAVKNILKRCFNFF